MKILCITPLKHISGAWKSICLCGEVIYEPNADLASALSIVCENKPDVIFVNPNQMSFRITREILCYGAKVVCSASTGLNHIDLDYCKKAGIRIISLTNDYEAINKITSTAEMAFALTLAILRNVPSAFDAVKRYEWTYLPYIGRQMSNLCVGIVGYGRLGKMYANYCKAFGMHISICDPYVNSEDFANRSLKELFEYADVVSLHVHLNKETQKLINSNVLSLAKKCYLINTSRGGVVNEDDVILALKNKNLSGYATDVLADELGNLPNSKLIKSSLTHNIIITPHIGGMTVEAQEIAYNSVIQNLKALKKDN